MQPSDLVQLYVLFHHRLQRMVRACVHGPDPAIEDACQVAWTTLIAFRDRVDLASAPGWLVQTAVHEALRLVSLEDREDSLERELEERPEASEPHESGPEDRVLGRQRIQSLNCLPVRQQRLVWLRALGLSYEEMASHECCTSRTVHRQLERARRSLRALDAGAGSSSAAA